MPTMVTTKGQVTIPKKIRDELQFTPGSTLEFAVNRAGEVVLQKTSTRAKRKPDRFEAVRGKADVKWRTDDLMALLRGEN